MTTYSMPAPDGNTYQIEGPAGATDDQVRQQILAQHPNAGTAKPTSLAEKGEKALQAVGGAGLSIASGAIAAPVSGLAGGLAGLATGSMDTAASVQKSVQEGMTYQPRTEGGKAGAGAIAKPMQKLAEAGDVAGQKVSDVTGSPTAGALTNAAVQAVPAVLDKAIAPVGRAATRAVGPLAERVAARGEEATAIRAAEEAPKTAKIEQAKALGIRLPPSEAGGPVGKVLEGASGKVQTEMALSRKNAPIINRAAAEDVGLSPRQSPTPAAVERLKQAEFKKYDRVKTLGRIQADEQFQTEMAAAEQRTGAVAKDYPEDINEGVQKEIAKFNKPSADAASMLDRIKTLRQKASKNMQAQDYDKFELGLAQKKIATAMEGLIERQGGATAPEIIKGFREARVKLAKIYNLEDALSPNGNVSAAVLARQLDNGVPLTGNLRTIAETYKEFPKVLRYVDNLGGHAPFSALDYLVGGVEAIAHPAAAARIGGALLGRPIARGVITSKPYQAAAIKPRPPKPSVATKAARAIANRSARLRDLSDYPQLPPPSVGNVPTQ